MPVITTMPTNISELANTYLLFSAMVLLLGSGILAPLHKNKRLQLILNAAALFVIMISSYFLFTSGATGTLVQLFAIYPFSMFFVFLFAASLLMVYVMSYRYSKDYLIFSMLLGFVALGLFSIAMSNSLITILLGLELVTLPTAFLIMMNGKHNIEAAVKLFIISALAISMLTFAIALMFPYDLQLSLSPYASSPNFSGGYLIIVALLLFIAGLSFDASIFPFNLWVPDVYSGSPANITALLAGINKKVAFVALLEVLFIVMLPYISVFAFVFQILAILTMFFGNIAALVQKNVKRLFAYSSISQAGYIAIGLAVASQYSISASIFQIVAHTFMIIGTFAIILWLEGKNIKSIDDYGGLASRNAFAALALTVFMLSMIGIPPLIGFVGKFLLFTSAIDQGLVLLAIIAIANSFISVYYYAKVILSMYSKREKDLIPREMTIDIVVLACLIIVVLVGVYPQPLISAASTVATSLFSI